AAGYDLGPQLQKLVMSPHAEVRVKVYELARTTAYPDLREQALAEIQADNSAATPAAIAYALAVSSNHTELARQWIESPNTAIAPGASPAWARDLISAGWVGRPAAAPPPGRRALAARALGIAGDQGTEALHRLLADVDPAVVAAACRAAGELRNRA